MVCQGCLHENDPFANYCGDCGRGLKGQGQPVPDAIGVWSDRARSCKECAERIPPRSRFCIACGAVPADAARRARTPLLIGAMVIGIVLLASFAAFLIPGRPG
jgi:hypothetical protein